MLRPWWFPEYTPEQQIIFDQIKAIIEKNYKLYWYSHIHTPAVESNQVLLKGGEKSTKQIFGLYGMAQGGEDLKKYSLHFDLTIPFARYVLDHENDITFPFKRSQIQPVRRGERNQRGRFKEFWQADIDIVWRKKEKKSNNNSDENSKLWSNLFYDAESVYVVNKILNEIKTKLNIKETIEIRINNRNLVQWLADSLFTSQEDKSKLFGLLDDYYKIGQEKFESEIKWFISDTKIISKVLKFTHTNSLQLLSKLWENFIDNEQYRKWYLELQEVFTHINNLNKITKYRFAFDPFIMRGLDYYTGTVYETFLLEDIGLWSISSGGRYEDLTKAINPKGPEYEGVGMSIGLSRLCTILFEKTQNYQPVWTEYLFINFEETLPEIIQLMQQKISQWHTCEIYPSAEKFKKQFSYADKKNIPYVVVLGEEEKKKWVYKVKDMKTGEEREEGFYFL